MLCFLRIILLAVPDIHVVSCYTFTNTSATYSRAQGGLSLYPNNPESLMSDNSTASLNSVPSTTVTGPGALRTPSLNLSANSLAPLSSPPDFHNSIGRTLSPPKNGSRSRESNQTNHTVSSESNPLMVNVTTYQTLYNNSKPSSNLFQYITANRTSTGINETDSNSFSRGSVTSIDPYRRITNSSFVTLDGTQGFNGTSGLHQRIQSVYPAFSNNSNHSHSCPQVTLFSWTLPTTLPHSGTENKYASQCEAMQSSWWAASSNWSMTVYNEILDTKVLQPGPLQTIQSDKPLTSKYFTWLGTGSQPFTTLCDGYPRASGAWIPLSATLNTTTIGPTEEADAATLSNVAVATDMGFDCRKRYRNATFPIPKPSCSVNPVDCAGLWAAFVGSNPTWTAGAPDGISHTTPSCAPTGVDFTAAFNDPLKNACQVSGNTVRLRYWPAETSPSNPCENGLAGPVTSNPNSTRTTTIGTITITSPDAFLEIDSLVATWHNPFPALFGTTLPVGATFTNISVTVPPDQLSTIIQTIPGRPLSEIILSKYSRVNTALVTTWEPYDFQDLEGLIPARAYFLASRPSWYNWLNGTSLPFSSFTTIFGDHNPFLSIPTQIRAIDSRLATCSMALQGLYDPPEPLVSALFTSATPNPKIIQPPAEHTAPAPGNGWPSPPPPPTLAPTPANVPHPDNPPNPGSAQLLANPPVNANAPSSANPRPPSNPPPPANAPIPGSLPHPPNPLPSANPPPLANAPPSSSGITANTRPPTNGAPLPNSPPQVNPELQVSPPSSANSADPNQGHLAPLGSSSQPEQKQQNAASPAVDIAAQFTQIPALLTFGDSTIGPNAQGNFVVGGQTPAPGSAAVTVSGTPVSVTPDGNTAAVGGQTQTLAAEDALAIEGSTIAADAKGIFVVAGQTVAPGAPAVTISGKTVSIVPGGASAVISGKGQALAAGARVLTLGGATHTADADGKIVIGGQTLTPDGPGITVSGTPISLASDGSAAVVGGSKQVLGMIADPSRPITAGSAVFTPGPSGIYHFGSLKLTPGGVLVTISRTTVSLGQDGRYAVVNGVTSTRKLENAIAMSTKPVGMRYTGGAASLRGNGTKGVGVFGIVLGFLVTMYDGL